MSDTREKPAKRRGRPPKEVKQVPTPSLKDVVADLIEAAPVVSDRPPLRPSMRDEDPRAAAARRAAEIRGHLGGLDEGTDEFTAPTPPDGWSYEWKARTIMGAEDPARQVQLARTGWEPVPTARHPEMMPHNGAHPIIERKGMVLMQRPLVITEEARSIEGRRAKDQIRAKKEQLTHAPEGQFERSKRDTKLSNSYEPLQVPND